MGPTRVLPCELFQDTIMGLKYRCTCRDEELYRATNGSSLYPFDPDYGGKLILRTFIAREDHPPAGPRPLVPEKRNPTSHTDG